MAVNTVPIGSRMQLHLIVGQDGKVIPSTATGPTPTLSLMPATKRPRSR